MASSTTDPRAAIRAQALQEGFDAVRFARTALPERARADLSQYLAEGRHGAMAWMAEHEARRGDPKVLWPDAKSVIVLGANYGPARDPLADRARGAGAISVYARGDDYHDVLKKKLKRLARFVVAEFGGDVKVFVDTAPVMEKPLAQAAGLGWQGKHTNLVSREFGSWLFLASIFTTLELEADTPETDHCGGCTRCLEACPTRAFTAPYKIDARRCISYLTIEHKDHIPREFREAIGDRIYGCDDCLAVCPWNKFASVSHEAKFQARAELEAPSLEELAKLDDAAFRALFRASPVKRTGRDRFVRNVLIAIGNSGGNTGQAKMAATAEALLDDASPLVRAMAVWAMSKLEPARLAALAAAHAPDEADAAVLAEWDAAISPPR
ncbi:MAG: tRNA epoxyqueuosine(34) reductase QueG [Alphaproteobacteria bacterium]|nr:tRNA epoxyqueuosine(34) reductase QueG [Alphaproteobacteria bacterium]MDE2014214.1 tRNA epoxyqueuosine(34) reductase QueG [Alphaproteobacteria bacterium]MDE2074535.1 tRNA epoxyqueuosine(34) reductase QueG [Alphaproteobacteria bacterium]